jgi:amino acid transporter
VALYSGAGAGSITLRPIYDPGAFSFATVAAATSIAVLSFLGFDGISTLSEESKGGVNSVGRATVLSLVLVGVLFMLQTWIATDLSLGMHFTSPETAFYEIAQRAGGTPLRLAIILATVISVAIANAIAAQAAVARVLFAMARDGKLPAVLARIHPRYLSPYMSILVVTVISFAVGLIFANRLDDLTSIVNFGALTSFVLLHMAVINHYFIRQRSGAWLRHLAFPLAGMSIILYVLYEMDRTAKVMGAIWIGVGIVYYLALTFWVRRAVVLRV